MPGRNASPAGDFESAAQRMLDALEKAGQELSQSVSTCVEQLSTYNIGLQKALEDRLRQVKEQLQVFRASSLDSVDGQKVKLIKLLKEFEDNQIDTIVSAGEMVRESIITQGEKIEKKLHELAQEKTETVGQVVERTKSAVSHRLDNAVPALAEIAGDGKSKIDQSAVKGEDDLEKKVADLELALQEKVTEWKESTRNGVADSCKNLSDIAASAREELDDLVDKSGEELKKTADDACESVRESMESQRSKVVSQVDAWQRAASDTFQKFSKSIDTESNHSKQESKEELDLKFKVAQEEISVFLKEATEKIQSSHKSAQTDMRRQTEDFKRQLETLLSSFDATLSEATRRTIAASNLQKRTNNELNEKLNTLLTAKGVDLYKQVHELADKLETDYVKTSHGLEDKIEALKYSAVESLEKQVLKLKSDVEKVRRSFQSDIHELENQIAEIEGAGKAAAMTLKAYGSSILSLDN